MRIYVAARHARKAEMLGYVRPVLMAECHEVTSRWLTSNRPPDQTEALVDIADIDSSDCVLVVTDRMGTLSPGGGRWFEAGYAHGRGKRVIFVGDPEIIFCHLPGVEHYPDLNSAVRALSRGPL